MWTSSRSDRLRRLGLLLAVVAGLGAGCSAPKVDEVKAPVVARGNRVEFELAGLDGKPLSTASLADRVSAVAFLATYDLASQAQARILANVARKHTPRMNLALLFLEAPENQPLVEAFLHTLALPFQTAMADPATIAGTGPFAGLHHVPSIVLLDREGREAWRRVGLCAPSELEHALRELEQRDGLVPLGR